MLPVAGLTVDSVYPSPDVAYESVSGPFVVGLSVVLGCCFTAETLLRGLLGGLKARVWPGFPYRDWMSSLVMLITISFSPTGCEPRFRIPCPLSRLCTPP